MYMHLFHLHKLFDLNFALFEDYIYNLYIKESFLKVNNTNFKNSTKNQPQRQKKDYKRLNISIRNPFFILRSYLSRLFIFLITIHQQNPNKLTETLTTIYLISK